MGDRGNVAIKSNGHSVWFYTHQWGGELPQIVAEALAQHKYWQDPPYLAKLVWDCLTKEGVGFGISWVPGDNQYPFVVVDCDQQACYFAPDLRSEDLKEHILPPHEQDLLPVPFAKWVARYGPKPVNSLAQGLSSLGDHGAVEAVKVQDSKTIEVKTDRAIGTIRIR